MLKFIAILILLVSPAFAQIGGGGSASGGSPGGSAGGDLSGTYPNPTVTKASSGFTVTGTETVSSNLNVQGNVSSTATTAPASITNSGVALVGNPSIADVQFFNQTYTANNRIAEWIHFQNCLSMRFKSDDQATAIIPISACGGQGTGITGIISNSGTGSWVHTGSFTTTGAIDIFSSASNQIVMRAAGHEALYSNGGVAFAWGGGVTSNYFANGLTVGSFTATPSNGLAVGTTAQFTVTGTGLTTAPLYATSTNCSSSASPAVCGAAAAGSVAIVAGTNPTIVVNTTAVTANSQIILTEDQSLGTKLGVTCNTTLPTGAANVTARTAGTSFTAEITGVFSTNPVCVSYSIVN
jgi:hypothetical protein